jgi:transposase
MAASAHDTEKPVFRTIPVQLTEDQFEQFILPHLSLPKRGPHCKIGYQRVFNYILTVLYTGMQWKQLPIVKDAKGHAELHYTVIYKLFARWADDGSLKRAFIASVAHLEQHHHLDLSILHGDGTNTVAKKGAMVSATRDTNTSAARRCWRSRTTTALSSRP